MHNAMYLANNAFASHSVCTWAQVVVLQISDELLSIPSYHWLGRCQCESRNRHHHGRLGFHLHAGDGRLWEAIKRRQCLARSGKCQWPGHALGSPLVRFARFFLVRVRLRSCLRCDLILILILILIFILIIACCSLVRVRDEHERRREVRQSGTIGVGPLLDAANANL